MTDVDDIMTGFVLDNGSQFIRVGFTGDDMPRGVFPTVAGRLRSNPVIQSMGKAEICVGDDVNSFYDASYPYTRGLVNDWKDMQRIWHHAFFDQLKLGVYETSTIMTESVLNTTQNREKTTEIMFETFDSPAFFMHNSATFAFLGTGKKTGIIVESGHDTTTVSPFYEGNLIKHAVQSMDIGGEDLTAYLIKMLAAKTNREEFARPGVGHEIARNIKEKAGYVALDPEQPGNVPYSYETGDGTPDIVVTEERHKCTEPMFQPPLLGLECDGIHQLILNTVNKTDPEIRATLWKNIVLVGGNTLLTGFKERLEKELTALAPKDVTVGITARDERKYSVFAGASMLANLSQFQKYWITKDVYDDYGPAICEIRQKEFIL